MICGNCGESYTPLVDEHDCFPEYAHQSCPPEEALPEEGYDPIVDDTLLQLAREGNRDWYARIYPDRWSPQDLMNMSMEEYAKARGVLLPAMDQAMSYQMLAARQIGKNRLLSDLSSA